MYHSKTMISYVVSYLLTKVQPVLPSGIVVLCVAAPCDFPAEDDKDHWPMKPEIIDLDDIIQIIHDGVHQITPFTYSKAYWPSKPERQSSFHQEQFDKCILLIIRDWRPCQPISWGISFKACCKSQNPILRWILVWYWYFYPGQVELVVGGQLQEGCEIILMEGGDCAVRGSGGRTAGWLSPLAFKEYKIASGNSILRIHANLNVSITFQLAQMKEGQRYAALCCISSHLYQAWHFYLANIS